MNPQQATPIATFAFLPQPFSLFFSFSRGISFCAKKSLAGDEKLESKNSQLSSLRKDFVRGSLEKTSRPTESEVPSMWRSADLESWQESVHFRGTALLLPRLRTSIHSKVVTVFSYTFFLFEAAFV